MEKDKVDNIKKTSPSYTTLQLGVWRVIIANSVVKLPGKESFSVLPLVLAFAAEIYRLAPNLVIFYVFTKVWSGIQSSLILRTSSHLLTIVSNFDNQSSRLVSDDLYSLRPHWSVENLIVLPLCKQCLLRRSA